MDDYDPTDTRHILLPGGSKGGVPKRFYYTYQDIANLSGLTASTIQKYATTGRLDPHSLESVVDFLTSRC